MATINGKKPEKEKKISFLSKETTTCPVCDRPFHREELFTGRVNSDELTDELHRLYKPTKAYGEVHPLSYDILVCPSCYYSAYKMDFLSLGAKHSDALRDEIQERVEAVQKLWPKLDYQENRRIQEGAASYYLAMYSYKHAGKDYAPTFKNGLSCLRCAWLCKSLHQKEPDENWDYVASIFYRKARFYYKHVLELEENRKEPCSILRFLGPDTDKNYGYEGVVYVAAMLEFKYGPKSDHSMRMASLGKAKINVARMFGFGKKSKNKPGPLLEIARNLYDKIKVELKADDDDE